MMLETVEATELIGPHVGAEQLLLRLFQRREPARLHGATGALRLHLRTGEGGALAGRSTQPSDIAAMTTPDGKVTADCQFCGAHYEFDPSELGSGADGGIDLASARVQPLRQEARGITFAACRNATPLSRSSSAARRALNASNVSVQPPTCSPPTKICGMVGEPVRARRRGGSRRPSRPSDSATESRSTERYGIPDCRNSLRTDQQNSHHSSANITTGCAVIAITVGRRTPRPSGPRRRLGGWAAVAGGGAGFTSKRSRGVERCDRDLLVGHVGRDVLEQRRREIALAGVGQHAQDRRARGRAVADRKRARERRAAGDAGEDALLLRQLARQPQRVAAVDAGTTRRSWPASTASSASLGMKSGAQPCIRCGRNMGWLAAGRAVGAARLAHAAAEDRASCRARTRRSCVSGPLAP